MEFNEKLQALRAKKGITQEELAKVLYVSRTAVSKWESGRGYPNIESLRAIARFYSVSVDELLSCDEALSIAQEDSKQKEGHYRDMVTGLLDISAVLLFFLPLFGQNAGEVIRAVSLIRLSGVAIWLRCAYFVSVTAIMITGTLTLALQNCCNTFWVSLKSKLSLSLNALAVLIFVLSLQPYAASFLFVFLLIKAFLLIKWQ